MTSRRKWLIAAGAVVLLGFLSFRAIQANRENAVEVRAEVVGPRDLVARVSATGHIEPKRSVDISADISGRIVRLPVEEGEAVEEGDLLLAIDPTQYEAAVRQARARLAEARAQEARVRADYQQAKREWERLKQLKERTPELVTDQETEQTRTRAEVQGAALQAARHAVQQAEAAVEEAENRLDKTVIRAPMSGRITRLNVEKGETAVVGTMNNPGSLLLTVADLSVMETVVQVDETDIPAVQVGDSASVEIDAFPDTAFAGRVTKIGNSSLRPRDQRTGSSRNEAVDFEVRITLTDPPRGIRPDLSATADIITDRRRDALAIPIIGLTLADTATKSGDGESDGTAPDGGSSSPEVEGVYVVQGDRVRFRALRVGIAGDNYFEVLEGLSAGDTVVSGSYQAIRDLEDGDRIELTQVEGRPASRGPAGEEAAASGGEEAAADTASDG